MGRRGLPRILQSEPAMRTSLLVSCLVASSALVMGVLTACSSAHESNKDGEAYGAMNPTFRPPNFEPGPEVSTPKIVDKGPAPSSPTSQPSVLPTPAKPHDRSNADLVVKAATELWGKTDSTALGRYFMDPYPQHDPFVPSGLAAMKMGVDASHMDPMFSYTIVRTIADGDLVTLHGRYTGTGVKPSVAFDMYRVANGKLVEHWDCVQDEATSNPSGHTMLDGAIAVDPLADTDANKKLVGDFVQNVLVDGKRDHFADYFAGTTYTQHSPAVGDGSAGLSGLLDAIAMTSAKTLYTKLHRVVGDGDFVITVSEGSVGGKTNAFYDMFRVADGKIAEHWDVVQEVPAMTASGLSMF
jgi:predicted SnoaL-like aldol condensation-catalyzing enzyme